MVCQWLRGMLSLRRSRKGNQEQRPRTSGTPAATARSLALRKLFESSLKWRWEGSVEVEGTSPDMAMTFC